MPFVKRLTFSDWHSCQNDDFIVSFIKYILYMKFGLHRAISTTSDFVSENKAGFYK